MINSGLLDLLVMAEEERAWTYTVNDEHIHMKKEVGDIEISLDIPYKNDGQEQSDGDKAILSFLKNLKIQAENMDPGVIITDGYPIRDILMDLYVLMSGDIEIKGYHYMLISAGEDHMILTEKFFSRLTACETMRREIMEENLTGKLGIPDDVIFQTSEEYEDEEGKYGFGPDSAYINDIGDWRIVNID